MGAGSAHHPVDQKDQAKYKKQCHRHTHRHQMQGVELGDIVLKIAATAHAKEAPEHGLDRVPQMGTALVGGQGHTAPLTAIGSAGRIATSFGAAGTGTPTSKKV